MARDYRPAVAMGFSSSERRRIEYRWWACEVVGMRKRCRSQQWHGSAYREAI